MRYGWEIKRLGDVCTTGSGGTPSKSKKEYHDNGNIPWLLSGEVGQGEITKATNFITQNGLENSSAKFFPKNTILVAMYGATAGQVGILRFESATNQAICGIFPNDRLMPEFLYYCLLAKKDGLIAQAAGNAQPNISQIKIRNTDIPIPPLPEQRRIVGILDEAFAAIATATANAKKNLAHAQELFESELNRVFTQRGEGWVDVELVNACKKIQDGAHRSPKVLYSEPAPDRFPYLTSKNIRTGYLKLDSIQYCDTDFHNEIYPRCNPEVGDVLLTKDGANTGNVALNTLDKPFSMLSSVCLLKPDSEKLLSQFLLYYIQSKEGFEQITGRMTGTAIKRIILKTIKSSCIPLPNISEQEEIVSSFDRLSAKKQSLIAVYEQKLTLLAELKQSLLHRAFSGELTADTKVAEQTLTEARV